MQDLLNKIEAESAERLSLSPGRLASQELPRFRAFLKHAMHRLKLAHQNGGGGLAVCQARSASIDCVVRALWVAAVNTLSAQARKEFPPIAVVALGGYGRGEPNPHSDIDLLAITRRFRTLEPPQKPSCPYYGDPVADFLGIRSTSHRCLEKAFPTAEIDNNGTKSLTISGGSLSRKIDVVPANWYDTNRYAEMRAERYRAIQVLNVKSGERIVNMPFMHNYLIQELDRKTGGGLRKVIPYLLRRGHHICAQVDRWNTTATQLYLNEISQSLSQCAPRCCIPSSFHKANRNSPKPHGCLPKTV